MLVDAVSTTAPYRSEQKFFGSFFFKKELLSSCFLFASFRLEHFQPDWNRPS
jgi:hypothetical protein